MSIWKRSISLMLVLLMCFSFMSSSFIMAFADDEADVTEETEVVQVEDEVDVPEEEDVRSPEADVVDEPEVVDASEDTEDSTDVVEPSEEPIESEEATTEVPEETEIQSTEETEVVEEPEVPEETKISEETEAPEETNAPEELEGPVDASEKLIGIKYSGVWGTTSIIEADGTSHDFFTSFDAVADYAPDENDFVGYIKPVAGSKVKVVSYYDAGNWDIKVYSVKGEDVTSIQSHQSMGETRAEITLTGDEDYIAVTFSPKPIQASTRAISAGSSISLAAIHFKNTGNFDASGDVGAGNEPKDGIDIIYAKGSSSGQGTPVYCLDGMAQHYEGAPMDYFGAIIDDNKVERAGYGLCNPILDYAYNMHGASTSQYGNFSRAQIFKMLDHILVHGYKGTEINMNNMPLDDKMSFAETQVALWSIQMYIVYGRIPYRGWNGVNAPGHIEKYFKVPSAEYDACKALVANARSNYSSLTEEQLDNCLVWTKEVKMQSGNTTRFVQPIAYYKQQVNKGYSLKKSVVNNASLQACVKDNPLYSLAGAQYGIYTNANATGTPVETLTTDANGNATGTKTFAVGTTIYAKETKAPTGYLKDTTIYSITIGSDVSQNVFKVQDTPALDPLTTRILKVDKNNNIIYLAGAVFKLTYYSAHWANDETPVKRVWYFKTDANGNFKYNESYLASGYSSDPLFKNQHGVPQLPLGIVQVKEEKAPEGFKLLDKVIYYNITQGSDGYPVGEWVTPSLKPISQDPNYTPWFQYSASDDTLKIYNKENSKPVTVKKVTANNADLIEGNNAYTLKGAKFEFSAEGYETKTVSTNANGEASSPLEYVVGTVVTIKEISAPAGHTIPSTNTKTITVKENQDNIVTFADPPIFGKAPTIKKLDAVTGEPLGLAEFEIKYYPGTSTMAKYTWTAVSDATTGLVDFNFSKFPNGKIPFGCFEVKEIKAPENYLKTDVVGYFRVSQDDPQGHWVKSLENDNPVDKYNAYVEINPDGPSQLMWKNNKQSKPVSLKKAYSATSAQLALIENNSSYSLSGARYEIWVSDSKEGVYTLSETVKTNAHGEATSAEEYYIGYWVKVREIEAPAGCVLNDEFTAPKEIVDGENLFNVKDEPVFGKMPEIIKVDEDTGEKLPGAVFKYSYYAAENAEGEAKYTWYFVTDADGKIKYDSAYIYEAEGYESSAILKDIPLGTVVVEEVKAPEGYKFAGNYKATWTIRQHESGSAEVDSKWQHGGNEPAYIKFTSDKQPIVWGNTLVRYSFSGKKVDALTGEMSHFREGDKLEAEFDLYYDGQVDAEGNLVKEPVWFNGSEGFEKGWYEAGAKIGHFKVEDGQIYTSDAIYAPGQYHVKEIDTTKPVDYRVVEETKTFVLSAETAGNVHFVVDEPMKVNVVTLQKIDALSGKPEHFNPELDFSAKFNLVYTGEKAITIMVGGEKKTFKTGDVIVEGLVVETGKTWSSTSVFTGEGEGLPAGTYKFVETEVPYGYDKCEDIEVVINSESDGRTYGFEAKEPRLYGGVILMKVNELYDEMTIVRHNFEGIKFNIKSANDFSEMLVKDSDVVYNKDDIVMTVDVHWNPDVNAWQASTIEYVDGKWQEKETGYVLLPGMYYLEEVSLNDHGQANDSYFVDTERKAFEVVPETISDKYADEDSAIIAKDRPVRGNISFQKLSQSHYPVEGVPYLLTNTTTGEQHIIVTGTDGWFFSSTEYGAEDVNLNDDLMEILEKDEDGLYTINTKDTRIKASDLKVGGVWFYIDESGTPTNKVDLANYGALSVGHYVLQELYAEANWGLDSNLNHEEFDVTNEELFTGEPAEIALSDDGSIIDDEHLEIKTNAWNAELALGHHMVLVGKGENKIIDTVSVNADGIVPGYKYRLNAQLHTYYFNQASLDGIVGTTEFSYDTIEDILEADAADGEADGIIHIDVVLSIPDDFYDLVMEEGIAHIDLEGRYTYIAESLEVLARNKESDEQYWEQRAEHNDKNDTNQWILFPKIRTRAWDKDTQDHVSRETLGGNDTVTWIDELKYEAIWEGYNVKVHTWLVDSETGEPLVIDGEPVDTWREFTSQWYTGSFQVDVTLKTEGLVGKTYTFMEEVYAVIEDGEGGTKEVLIGEHKDKDDVEQQIQIPEGRTTAWGAEQGVHMVQESTSMEVNDLFFYHNLIEGKEYELDVALALKSGELIGLKNATVYFDGKKIEGTTGKFTATGRDGIVHIMVVFDGTDLAGSPIVFLERVRYNDVDIILHADLNDEEQTVNVIDIHTLAHFDEGLKYVQAGSKVKWYDEVSYTGLEVGKEYALDTKIAFKDAKVIEGNAEIKYLETGEMRLVFTPEKPDGKVIIETEIDTAKLGGKAFVFFEYLSVLETSEDEEGNKVTKETEVAKHEDLEDEGQTVRVLDMRTKAVSEKNGTKILEVGKTVQLRDTVSNFGFPIDEEFTWVGYVYDVATGKPIEQNGEPIKLEWTGKLSDPNQEIIMKFTLDTTVLEGKKLSIMEEVYNKDGKLILEHNKDLKDDDQTVTVDTSVRTGDGTTPMSVGIGLVTAGIMLATMLTVMYVRKRKVNSAE